MMTVDQFVSVLKEISPSITQDQIDASVAEFNKYTGESPQQQRSRAIAGFIIGLQAEDALDEARRVIALYRGVVAKILDAMKDIPQ